MNTTIKILTVAIALHGCASSPKLPNPVITGMIDNCIEKRRSTSNFNQSKTIQLVRLECEQLLTLNHDYLLLTNEFIKQERRKPRVIQQYTFDDKTWFLITEKIRKDHYPEYLDPESEVIRANVMADEQAHTITDETVRRHFKPRLLPVSPYLMDYKQLSWAGKVADDLIFTNQNDEALKDNLYVIRNILDKERRRKDPYVLHPAS